MSTLAAACTDQINIFCFVLTPDYKMISQRACLLLTLHLPCCLIDTRGDMLLGRCKLSTTLSATNTQPHACSLLVYMAFTPSCVDIKMQYELYSLVSKCDYSLSFGRKLKII